MFDEIHYAFITENTKIAFFDVFISFPVKSSQTLHSQNLSKVRILFICLIFLCKQPFFGDFGSKRTRNKHSLCIFTLIFCKLLLSIYQCISVPSLKFLFLTRCVLRFILKKTHIFWLFLTENAPTPPPPPPPKKKVSSKHFPFQQHDLLKSAPPN